MNIDLPNFILVSLKDPKVAPGRRSELIMDQLPDPVTAPIHVSIGGKTDSISVSANQDHLFGLFPLNRITKALVTTTKSWPETPGQPAVELRYNAVVKPGFLSIYRIMQTLGMIFVDGEEALTVGSVGVFRMNESQLRRVPKFREPLKGKSPIPPMKLLAEPNFAADMLRRIRSSLE